jgi:acyl-CoA thioester hydrolase
MSATVPMSTEIPNRDQFPVLRPMPTRWMDNDHYGHVNNAAYYSFFDTAVNGYLMDATGMDTRNLDAIGIVAETSCRYLSEVSFPALLHVGLRLEKLGRSSVIYQLGLFREDATEPSAVGRFVHVYLDNASRKPVPIPAIIRSALEKLLVRE